MLLALVVPAAMWTIGQARRSRPETTAFAMLRDELAARDRTVVLVCGDRWFPTLARFHFGFDPPANLMVVSAGELPPLPAQAVVRAIVDVTRSAPIPEVLLIEALHLPPLLAEGHLRLYAVEDVDELRRALQPSR